MLAEPSLYGSDRDSTSSKANFERPIIVRRLSMLSLVSPEQITDDEYLNSTLIKQKLIDYINDLLLSEGYKNEFPKKKPKEIIDLTSGKKSRKPVPKVPMDNQDDQEEFPVNLKKPGPLLPLLKVWIKIRPPSPDV